MLEVVLAIGLSALVLYTVVSVWTSYNSQFQKLGANIEMSTDIESGEQILLKDLKAVDPSFGILTLRDDTNDPRSLFFDYFPDVPESQLPIPAGCGGRPCRTYTLRPDGYGEIVLALLDSSPHPLPSMIYDPIWAYTTHACTQCNTVSGPPPTYSPHGHGIYGDATSTSAAPIVAQRGPVVHNGIVEYPGYWRQDQLLMLDTPVSFRPNGTPQSAWAAVPPRPEFFIGRVASVKDPFPFVALPVNTFDTRKIPFGGTKPATPDQLNLLNRTHPVYAGVTVDSPDKFFVNLPPVGGGQPTVRLRPIRLVKYSIEVMFPTIDPKLPADEQAKRRGALRVWRQLFLNGSWTSTDGKGNVLGRMMVAEWVKSVQLRRDSVTDKSIKFSLAKTVLPKGGTNP